MKSFELRKQSKTQLTDALHTLRTELQTLRVQHAKATGTAPKMAKIGLVRKDIARVLTTMSQQTRANLHVLYKGKKHVPTDLRAKKTRAIRRRLTVHQLAKKTTKQAKKDMHFPTRKYAVKA